MYDFERVASKLKRFRSFYIGQGIDLFITVVGAWLVWASIYTDTFNGPLSNPTDYKQTIIIGLAAICIGLFQFFKGMFKFKARYQKDGELFISQENLKEYTNMSLLVIDNRATVLTKRQRGVVKKHLSNNTPLKTVKYYDKNKNYISQSYYL